MDKFAFGAALTAEKKQKNCFINKCDSFVKIIFEASNVAHMSMQNNELTFDCDEFRVLPDESTPFWQKCFKYSKTSTGIKMWVPQEYSMGFPLSLPK